MDLCDVCNLPHPINNCLQALRVLVSQLETKLSSEYQKLEYYEKNSKSLEKIPEVYDSHHNIVHQHFVCDSCYENPIFGTRYKCKSCPNFDLCSACRLSSPHLHSDFYSITTSNFHKLKTCSICFSIINDILHKCLTCGQEICHECKLLNEHEHSDIITVFPFDIKVESYCNNKKNRYKNGDEVFIQFVVYNISSQVVNTLAVVEQDCPFLVVKRETRVNLHERDICIIDIAGVIKAPPNTYNSKFTFKETTVDEIIGPDVYIKFTVSEGLFSSFFKS
jgi:Zinc finger, ZZ type